MLKSWLLLLASDSGNGTPSSGSPAQEAVWPGDAADSRPRCPQVREDEDKAMKVRGSAPQKTVFRPDRESWSYAGGKTAAFCDDRPAYQAADAWLAERGDQCLI